MWKSRGKVTVTTSGTPVRLTVNNSNPALYDGCHAFLVEQLPTNSGKLYILDSQTGSKSTLTGVLAILPPPTTNILPVASITIADAPNALNAADYWLDADNSGEGALVSVVIG